MRAVLLLCAELGQQISDDDLNLDRIVGVTLVEVGIVERMIPLRAENAANGFENRRLGRITLSDQAKDLLVWDIPFKVIDTPEVHDL